MRKFGIKRQNLLLTIIGVSPSSSRNLNGWIRKLTKRLGRLGKKGVPFTILLDERLRKW